MGSEQATHEEGGGLVVGVDLGTSMVKVGVYDTRGTAIAMRAASLPVRHLAPGRVEQDLDDFYDVAAECCRLCLVQAGLQPSRVQGLAIAGQMAGVGLVGPDHRPLAPFDSWLDTRCSDVLGSLEPLTDEVIALAGCPPTISIGPKMAWWQRTAPDLCAQAAAFVTAAGYVAGRCTGRSGQDAFIDPTHLHFSSVADLANASWSPALVGAFGIDPRLLPTIVESTSLVGGLTPASAADFGLPLGTPVAAGCGDTAASALGAGALEPGEALDIAGTAGVFAAGIDTFVADVAHRTLMTMRSPLPGRWYALAYVGGAGQVVEWVCREVLGFDDADAAAYAALNEAASGARRGSDGLIMSPHFDGRVTPAAPSMRGSLIGLSHIHGHAHLSRAALESIAFEYRGYLDIIRQLLPRWTLQRIIGAGGGASSGVWNQIKADVLGAEYTPILDADPGTRGAALVAISALGMPVPDLPPVARQCSVAPDPAGVIEYAALADEYGRWSDLLAQGYSHARSHPRPFLTTEHD